MRLLTIVLLSGLVLVWLAALFLDLPLTSAALLTLGAILIVAGVWSFKFVRARARAAALERELLRQAAAQAARARPEQRQRIAALQLEMKRAVESLKRTRRGSGGGQAALYGLPWYVIVGPSGAGKTTALQQSGLSLASAAGGSGKLKGTAGTRNCDWWLFQEAILLDTAGRFTTEDDDQEEWLAFLQTLRRFRSERPLDGVLVAVSMIDVLNGGADEVEELAQRLRSKVEELANRLEMVLPVYLLFTKVDLIAGFVEFWSDLSKTGRAQPWGMTFADGDERLSEPARAFEAEFDTLLGALHARLMERVARERIVEARSRILQFPLEFQAAREPLARFAHGLCRANSPGEAPRLRGIYFSSGTQVGHPLDRVLGNMLQGFDLKLAPAAARAANPVQSYFVADVFKQIIVRDRYLAARSGSRVRRGQRQRLLLASGALALSAMIVVPSAVAYVHNVELIEATRNDVAIALAVGASSRRAAGPALDRMLERLDRLSQASAEFRVPLWLGPYEAPALHTALRDVYSRRLRSEIEEPVRTQLVQELQAASHFDGPDPERFRQAYDDLKLYLMLSSRHDKLDINWAPQRVEEIWSRAIRNGAPPVQKPAAHSHHYVQAHMRDPGLAWHEDDALVSRVRAALNRMPIQEYEYERLIEAAKGLPLVQPKQIFFGDTYVNAPAGVDVAGAFTALGWQELQPKLDGDADAVGIEGWVLGNVDAVQDQQKGPQLRKLYFERYIDAWTAFLAGLEVHTPADLTDAIQELEALSETEGPYFRLFRLLEANFVLDFDVPVSASAEGWFRQVFRRVKDLFRPQAKGATSQLRPPSPVEQHFTHLLGYASSEAGSDSDRATSKLNWYLGKLKDLKISLKRLKESRAEPDAEFRDELARTSREVEKSLESLDRTSRSLVGPLLLNPIRGSGKWLANANNRALSDRWKDKVWESYKNTIQGRYPFADAREHVAMAEFADFFRPETGVLWKFYAENLDSRLKRSEGRFIGRSAGDAQAFRADLLGCLRNAQQISDALFPRGASDPMLRFQVKMESVGKTVAKVILRIDDQKIVYTNDRERWVDGAWPGKGDPGAWVQISGKDAPNDEIKGERISRDGEFGFFHLLVDGKIKEIRPGARELSAGWELTPDLSVRIQIRPSKTAHPFAADFFRRLSCPRDIVSGGAQTTP